MKKNFLIILYIVIMLGIVLISSALSAQSRLGYSYSEIKTEFPGLSKGVTDDNIVYYYQRNGDYNTTYIFNEDLICSFCIVTPYTKGAYHYLIERLNNTFVIIDSKTWREYVGNSTILIRLMIGETSNEPFFVYEYE